MELLWIALLIQMIFFISQDLHYLVIGFIAFSLMISFVDIRPLVFVGIPMILCQMWYIYRAYSIEEGFKRRRRKRRGRPRGIKKKQWKKAGRFINKNKKYGLLAMGPAGGATFAALEAEKARKNKKRQKRSRKQSISISKNKNSTLSRQAVANDSHMKEHSRIKKQQDDLAKTNSQLRTTISNIHNISK